MERARFDNLRNGTPARLRKLKAEFEKRLPAVLTGHGEESEYAREYKARGWRSVRYGFPSGYHSVAYSAALGGVFHADSGALDHLRKPSESDMPRDYRDGRGWYTDDYQNGTASGRVAVLPSGRGKSVRRTRDNRLVTVRTSEPRYLAYVVMSDCDGITIDASVYTDPVAAWNNADRLAQRIAEEERENSELQNEAQKLADKTEADKDSMKAARATVRRAVSLLREIPATSANRPSLCADIRNARTRFRSCMARIAKRAPELAELRARGADV